MMEKEYTDPVTGEIVGFPAKIAPWLRTGYNYDTDIVSQETALACPEEEDKTQQQFKDETDINTIVQNFGLGAPMPEAPTFGEQDFSEVMDFQTAMNAIRAAEEAFMEFPAHIRARFRNDPQEMMDFLGHDKNRAEALELGLIAKPPEKTRDAVQAIDELRATMQPANPAEPKEK